ncbi:hypothetical protein NDU88_001959 [Pleurodeles waltl]|uniref:Uncharacterized protein n=1 Tax=Pleurodeles waltl TaxID=8319 RepID=A0AAV7Q8B8_PLEWA|nr:hypothetical protein NDU88_001959 [Pleurodeles waltl]
MPPPTLRAPGSPSLQPPLQLRPAGSRVQRSRLAPSADVPKFAHGRSLIHTALSSSRRSSAAPTSRGSRARVVASTLSRVPFLPRHTSVPARPRPGGSPVRPQLSRGSQSRPPFCFRGRDGRGSTTGAAFARCSSPEPPRGPGVTRTVKTTSPARWRNAIAVFLRRETNPRACNHGPRGHFVDGGLRGVPRQRSEAPFLRTGATRLIRLE